MDVTSSTNAPAQPEADSIQAGKDSIKKALEVQEKQILSTLEDVKEESQKAAAHKSGIGNTLNVSA